MYVQELYDYALKHGLTGESIHVHVLANDSYIEFISEHLDLVDFQVDSDTTDACLRLWVRYDKAEHQCSNHNNSEKQGHWIPWYDASMVKCSECNNEYYMDSLSEIGDEFGYVHFCPNCGAEMANTFLEKSEDDIGDE